MRVSEQQPVLGKCVCSAALSQEQRSLSMLGKCVEHCPDLGQCLLLESTGKIPYRATALSVTVAMIGKYCAYKPCPMGLVSNVVRITSSNKAILSRPISTDLLIGSGASESSETGIPGDSQRAYGTR